jgi:hypothetical protein
MEVVKFFCRGRALLRPCRRNWFYDNFRRIRIVLRADAGIGPYGVLGSCSKVDTLRQIYDCSPAFSFASPKENAGKRKRA